MTDHGGAWAVIPARGGSKGIPRKNLRHVGGVPLLSRAIRACVSARWIDKVIVSTDDSEMALLSEEEGASVVLRPAEIASDSASSESAVQHAIEQMADKGWALPEFAVLVQCTSPFLEATELDAVVKLLKTRDVDSCFTACRSHRFLWRNNDSGLAIAVNHDPARRMPRQSIGPEYLETGAAYGFLTNGFLECGSRFVGRVGLVEVDASHSLEIDDPLDLSVANMLESVNRINDETLKRHLPETVKALVFDFDGVFTDDKVTVHEDGTESIVASRSDGLGIALLRRLTSLQLLVVSAETNPVVARRCEKLKLDFISGVEDKDVVLKKWLQDERIDFAHCIYVGNDVNDLPAFEVAGYTAAPADAQVPVIKAADLVLTKKGGAGAVREICDILIGHPGTLRLQRE
jgi:YrbI family 3-deoxy-D-manno-octulosonate 8-phosphate phosphatase